MNPKLHSSPSFSWGREGGDGARTHSVGKGRSTIRESMCLHPHASLHPYPTKEEEDGLSQNLSGQLSKKLN